MGLGRAAGSFPCTARAPRSQCAGVHSCVCCVFVFLFRVPLPLSLILLTSLPASAVPSIPAPGTHVPARSWRSRSAGPDLFPTHPPEVLALPCPLSSVLYKQMAWQPGRQGSHKRMGEAGLSTACLGPFSPSPSPGTHPQAVPALGPLSLPGEASVYPPSPPPPSPAPFPSRGPGLWGLGMLMLKTRSQREALAVGWWGSCLMLWLVLHACVCTSTPPSLPGAEAPSPQHRALGAWRGGQAPRAGLPAGKGQASRRREVLQSRVGLPGDGRVAFGLGSRSPTSGASPDPPSPGSAAAEGARGPSTKLSLALFFEEPE